MGQGLSANRVVYVAKVFGMPEEYKDPSANTTQFQAFAAGTPPESKRAPVGLILGGAVLAVVVIGVAIWAFAS
ncbi:hypothetical protein GCM10010201_10120 [Pilimelia columellifera subsp. columellifera]|uniref:Uncharacterized protein n=2 Tax=Pilimelia TaxID=53370 RepID=A0ABN3NAV2_9ACTN